MVLCFLITAKAILVLSLNYCIAAAWRDTAQVSTQRKPGFLLYSRDKKQKGSRLRAFYLLFDQLCLNITSPVASVIFTRYAPLPTLLKGSDTDCEPLATVNYTRAHQFARHIVDITSVPARTCSGDIDVKQIFTGFG